ncbi:MAG: chalcone isomerase family protein [Planctomycetota bacterium]|jgi:hypothetical protein
MNFTAAPLLTLLGFTVAIAIAAEPQPDAKVKPSPSSLAPIKSTAKTSTPNKATPKSIARTGPGKIFPVRIDHPSGRKLHLNGWGLCEWGVFSWDLYHCALHVERKSKSARTLLSRDQAYSIHLHFERDLSRSQMRKAYRTSVEVNTGKSLSRYKKRLDRLLTAMEAVTENDNLRFVYIPDSGMVVTLNEKRLVTIEGSDWARMFLRLYVGSKPPTANLRNGMLGN